MIWNRLKYVLSPQFDIYRTVAGIVRDCVADIGFGTGFGTHLLTLNAKEVYGYEIDERAIRFAQEVFPFKTLHFNYGDIIRGFDQDIFDYVVMIDVIEHIKEDAKAVENVGHMLRSDGSFICSTPNRLSRYRKAETHCREYSPDEFECLLRGVFPSVWLRNYCLEPLASKTENPILAICQMKEK